MARTLDNLILEASSVLPNGFISKQDEQQPSTLLLIVLLAQYLGAEMRDLYSPTSDDQANLSRLIASLEVASVNLNEVTRCFRELRASLPSSIATRTPPF